MAEPRQQRIQGQDFIFVLLMVFVLWFWFYFKEHSSNWMFMWVDMIWQIVPFTESACAEPFRSKLTCVTKVKDMNACE
jgi:hypothetical protein